MGRMKEVYMQILQENMGQIPEHMTISDMARMKELETYNWEEYERKQAQDRLFRIKQENPREITKVAQTQNFWEEELRREEQREITARYPKNE
jgi:glucose dehydrogenase